MSSEQHTTTPATEIGEQQTTRARLSPAERRQLRNQRIAWWFKYLTQPVLTVAAIVAVVTGFGFAQRLGWFSSNIEIKEVVAQAGEEVLYICPMVCVPPSTEPGKCPVCGMDLEAQRISGDSRDKYGLRLDPASIRVANIRTAAAEFVPLVEQIRAIGEIGYDEGSLATISAYVDGRIEKLFADNTGVSVDQGDELALLYSPDLYSSQVAFVESLKLLENERARTGNVSDSNQRFYDSTRQRLVETGMTNDQVEAIEASGRADSRIRIVSPIGGTVIEKLVEQGQYLNTGQAIYKVADLSTVWLILELFPRDAAKINFGQKVVTRLQSIPGTEFFGRVAFVDPAVNTKTQTVSVRVVIPNEQGLIRVGDFATATIAVSVNATGQAGQFAQYDAELAGKWISPRHPYIIRDQPGVCPECGIELVSAESQGFAVSPVVNPHYVVVPRNAILMAGDESVAYVETEPGRFEFRNVEIGQIVGDRVSIISGIAAGEQVVVSAPLLVDSQFNMDGKPSLIDPARALPGVPVDVDPFDSDELSQMLSELSQADRDAVLKQKVCPVTNRQLGSMGPPVKVEVEGKTVFVCCEGCRGKLLADPEKYFSILANGPANESSTNDDGKPAITPLPQMKLPQMALPKMAQPNAIPPGNLAAASVDKEQSARIAEAMASLSPADRELAEKQKICPVADEPLGSMGTPIKANVNGRVVFICCEGCRKRLLEKPDEFLAKLPAETSR